MTDAYGGEMAVRQSSGPTAGDRLFVQQLLLVAMSKID
jgi:hypothetical protein